MALQPLRSGELHARLTLSSPYYTSPPDEIAGYTTLATVWASVEFSEGDESLAGDREVSLQKAKVKIRFREDVTTLMRATLNGVVYDIRKVTGEGLQNLREYLTLIIREVR